MTIPVLLALGLLGDADPEQGTATLQEFVSTLAMTDPRTDPRVDPFAEPAPLGGDDKTDFSYTWAEAGYATTKLDTANEYAHALFLRASIGFLSYFHVFGGVEREDTSFDNSRVDAYDVGGGVQIPILKSLDAVGEVSWLYNYIDSDHLFDKDTNTGVSLYAGGRWMPLDWSGGGLEIDGGYRYTDITSLLSDKVTNAIEVGARVHFLSHLSVGATYAFIEKDRELLVDLRFSF